MNTRICAALACVLTIALWAPGSARQTAPATNYDETMSFVRTAVGASPQVMRLTSMGTTAGGREIPLVIAGPNVPEGSAAIRALDKVRVFVQAGGHTGPDGTAAALMLLKDIATGRHDIWFTSLVLLINPIGDPDGTGTAHGNHVVLDSPETAAFARLLSEYDPQVTIELRSEGGPCSAYAVTFDAPRHPNTSEFVQGAMRDDWFPFIAKSLKARRGMEAFARGLVEGGPDGCGTVQAAPTAPTPAVAAGARRGAPPPAPARGTTRGAAKPAPAKPVDPPTPPSWAAVSADPARRTNYVGLRNRFAIAGVTHARDTQDDRTKAASAFLEETLSFVWAASSRIKKACEDMTTQMLVGRPLATGARPMAGGEIEILMSGAATPAATDGGAIVALKRTESSHVVRMIDRLRFEPASDETAAAEYFIPADLKPVLDAVRRHGIQLRQLTQPVRGAEMFVLALSTDGSAPTQLAGTWQPASSDVPAGSWVVRMNQPLARLAFTLLEPASVGGLSWMARGDGKTYAIMRRR